ncbi:MAG: carboxymethylenebutenolidase [Noviherbaspirillum sp.]|nr:carboxymethylenebutenolidase [Noviherbaspirillum sp.]
MHMKKADDFDPEVLKLFDKYVHGIIDRRGFLSGATKYAVGGVSAAMLLEALNPKFALAQKIAPDDKRIKASYVEYPSPQGHGKVRGYLVMPANAGGKRPGVLVVHENRGLNPHIEDVARRMALEGFVAFAPDGLTSLGGYPGDEDKGREAFAKLDKAKLNHDFVAGAEYLKNHPATTGKIGAVGFCYGGSVVNMLAARLPSLDAAVPFYGDQPSVEDTAKIRAPLLIHYAEKDERVNAGAAAYERALKAAEADYTVHYYAGTQHGFHNDATPRYDEAAARLAWRRTVDFFKRHLTA